ncbi:MAG: hypothetical protein K940chlam9_00972 [Chlamydiae bacterium]|nr:hypothetical protein [Chlamydiota bacterium]
MLSDIPVFSLSSDTKDGTYNNMMKRAYEYLTQGIWKLHLEGLSGWEGFKIRALRVLMLTSEGFQKSHISQGASALTYYTLLGIVPILAILIGIAKGFGLETSLETWLISQFPDQKDVLDQIFTFANNSLEKANQGLIAGLGILLLLWAGTKILMNLELVMNQIWEVREGRSLTRKFTDYLAMIVFIPLLVFLSSGFVVYLSATLTTLGESNEILSKIFTVVIPLLNLIPLALLMLMFSFLYIFMPNTSVHFLPALCAGIFIGCIYQLLQWILFTLQIGLTGYNAIYGTYAALPIFLVWIHLSWVLILLGAKIAFSIQNVHAFQHMGGAIQLSHKFRNLLSLQITHLVVEKFCKGEPPPTSIELSNLISIPLSLARNLIHELCSTQVLTEIQRDIDKETSYQPARSVDQLTIKRILDMINERGTEIVLPPSKHRDKLVKSLKKFEKIIEESDANLSLRNL